jgi:thioredoxin 1
MIDISIVILSMKPKVKCFVCFLISRSGDFFMSEQIVHITDDNFEEEVLNSSTPVLVDFWAEWCAPCRAIAPTLESIAIEYAGKLKIAKLDVDSNPQMPLKYGVRGIPTLIIFKQGQVVGLEMGALPKSRLIDFINSKI